MAYPATHVTAPAGSPPSLQTTAVSRSDFGRSPQGKAAYWKAEIHACDKEMEKWRKRATEVVKRYRDEREDSMGLGSHSKKYNMLWSIIRTTMPAVYGKPPKPIVVRRFTDPDNVARVAAMILERTLEFQLANQSAFHPAIRNALQDRLLPGMGTCWVRFQQAQQSPTGTLDNDYYARLSGTIAAVDFIYWEDFGFIPARTWEEVPAVWRVVYMTYDQLVTRFGKEVADNTPLDYVPARHPNASQSTNETDEPKNRVFKQAKIYEIWDKRDSKVTWISMLRDSPLDEKPDPMQFPDFFPCPKPLFATNTTGNLVPVPDYYMYQDQASEIDNLTQRLYMLTKALKVAGVYDQGSPEVGRLLTEAVDNQLIPTDQWAAFAEKGALKGTIAFLPIQEVIEVVDRLFNIRQQLIQDIYQITGLSDIIRGASNPNETLGAQKIKAQFASVRLSDLQQELARFVTEVLQRMGHVAIHFFDDKTLVEQSSIMQSPDGQMVLQQAQQAMQQRMQQAMQQMQPPPTNGGGVPMAQPHMPQVPPTNIVQQALQLLRKGRLVDYRIEVASDSMIEPDLEAERTARNEFITAVTQFTQQAFPAMQQMPALTPVVQALMMFGVRGYKVGRDVEGIIEAAFNELRNNPPQQPPDPKAEALKMKAQMDAQKQQADAQAKAQEQQGEFMLEQQRMSMELQKMREEMVLEREKAQQEAENDRRKMMAEIQAIMIKAFVEAEVKRGEMVQKAEAAAQERQGEVVQHAQDMELQRETHAQSMEQAKEVNEEKEKADGQD